MDNSPNWNISKVKGCAGENIVEFLINSTDGWKCYRYGMENHIEELRRKLLGIFLPTANKIRSMPDFVAVNEKKKISVLIEAKYSSYILNEKNKLIFLLKRGRMKDYLNYWADAKLVFVHRNKPYFYVINIKDIDKEKHFENIGIKSINDSEEFERWNFKDIVKDIKDLLPNITNETLNEAIKLIK